MDEVIKQLVETAEKIQGAAGRKGAPSFDACLIAASNILASGAMVAATEIAAGKKK